MKIDRKEITPSRRTVLKMLGVTSGVLMAGSPLSPFSMMAKGEAKRAIRVGVLNLKSPATSHIANDVLAGMRVYSNSAPGLTLHTVLHEFDRGVANCRNAYQSLVKESAVDVVIGVTNRSSTELLKTDIDACGIPYFEVSAGERIVEDFEQSPNIFRSSLGMWQSAYLVGGWAAQNIGSRCFIATSVQDCGYDHLNAFRKGFTKQNGTIVKTVITNAPAIPVSIEECVSQIKQVKPDVAYCLYSGAERNEFLSAYRNAGLLEKIPIIGGLGFALPTRGVLQAATWIANLNDIASTSFAVSYSSLFGAEPPPFASLGFDTAMLIDSAIPSHKSSSKFTSNLRIATVNGCRGVNMVKGPSQNVDCPVYLCGESSIGGPTHSEIGSTSQAELADINLGQRGGWTNAYTIASDNTVIWS